MQYNTLKRANLLASYLMDNGISPSRITIESLSDNFPMVKETISGKTNSEYLAYNKRIDWEIRDLDGSVLLSHSIDRHSIPGYALDKRYELFQHIREDVYYSVEIASSSHIYKNAILRLYDDLYIRKASPLAHNKYYIGIINKYQDVVALQKELEESSATYAKIVAFYNGMPIDESNIDYLIKDYPELKKIKDNR